MKNLLYSPFFFISGPDILRDLNEDEDGDPKQPGTSDGNDSSSPKKPSLSWNGKPKTMVQMAGEAVVARIVSKVMLEGNRAEVLIMIVGKGMLMLFNI